VPEVPQAACGGMSADSFKHIYSTLRDRVEASLTDLIQTRQWPDALREAVEYSLMAGGKRLRPILALIATEVCGGNSNDALSAACAIEMVHTYSLIHDDLPSMDDDDLRRGRPTSHTVFGEALAILSGDALLTWSFETLADADVTAQVTVDCLKVLARAAGGAGMVGGQILDLEAERGPFPTAGNTLDGEIRRNSGSDAVDSTVPTSGSGSETSNAASSKDVIHVEQLVKIHKMKTGALITAALELGATVAGATSEQRQRLKEFGQCTGLAFQIADDLLDVTGDDERLGKETGRDNELGKLTYPSLIGVEASRQKAESLVDRACAALDVFDSRADFLRQLARFIVERDH
jgi:geranylgeranyl diphosphate synthase, type II